MGSEDIGIDIEKDPEDSVESKPIDKVAKELAGIRKRRNTDTKIDFPLLLKTGPYLQE